MYLAKLDPTGLSPCGLVRLHPNQKTPATWTEVTGFVISGKEIIVNVISSPIDGYALVKVWNPELRREVIEAVAMNEIKGVKVSV